MPKSRVSRTVSDFVRRYLPSVQHLEVFMLLQRTRERFSSAAEIANELMMPHEAAAEVLETLGSYNLLDVKVSDDLRYRYNPATPTLDSAATQSAQSYQLQRMALLGLVAERSRRKGADPLI